MLTAGALLALAVYNVKYGAALWTTYATSPLHRKWLLRWACLYDGVGVPLDYLFLVTTELLWGEAMQLQLGFRIVQEQSDAAELTTVIVLIAVFAITTA